MHRLTKVPVRSVPVVCSRDSTGVESLLLGTVSGGLVQSTDHPVVVGPSVKVAAVRPRGARDR
jgi:hypothetical protein